MARSGLGKTALLLGWIGLTGCHLCHDECDVAQVCYPRVKKEKVKIDGWDVECERICIPPVHCPGSSSCEWKCGKVITVKKLKPRTIECGERCVVEYQLNDSCCRDADAEKADPETAHDKQPAPVEAPQPVETVPQPRPVPLPEPEVESSANVLPGVARVSSEVLLRGVPVSRSAEPFE